uniref:uncharacterized protein LOC120329768 n=1 Tax=Styela clava TaxID=7725 RepID=UPI00193A9FF9|nr:uncharacterized protein LOC120329768 [Styela clava]
MTSPIVTLVLFLSLSILTNGRRQERVCLQLESIEDVYGENRAEVQTIPGKKGPKGDRGFPGLKGSQAEVNYDELEALINRNVERAMKKQRAEMNETINELLERIEKLEGQESTNTFEDATTAPSVSLSPPPGFTEQDIVRYDGRMFIPLASEQVPKASAIVKCRQLGCELANIYNHKHMDMIMTFIRDNKMDGQSFKDFHLGMTYDPINQILRFQNGTVTSHSVFKWYPGYPLNGQSYSRFTNMFIRIHEDSTSLNQYFLNHPDYGTYVLCEV